jgi:hypothetical protein
MDEFWTDDVEITPNAGKYKAIDKFEPKILVWCIISKAGVSSSFIGTVKGQAIDADAYITICLLKMDKYIEKHQITKQSFGPIWHRAIMQRKC